MKKTGERFIPGEQPYHGLIEIELEHYNRYYFVVNQLDISNKIVLDIASGEGYGSFILSKFAEKIIGVDISQEAIKHASEKYQSENLKYVHGDATKVPLADNSIDIIVSFETIEHHDKHKEMMAELKRVLKPDGILIISSPDKYYFTELPKGIHDYHVKELYYDEFKSLINSSFKKSFFYSQKVFVGSIIALDQTSEQYNKPVVVDEHGVSTEFHPIYNIAIATDDPSFKPANNLVLYKQFDEFYTKKDVETSFLKGENQGMLDVSAKLKSSKAYRLGSFLLKPFKVLRAFF